MLKQCLKNISEGLLHACISSTMDNIRRIIFTTVYLKEFVFTCELHIVDVVKSPSIIVIKNIRT
jgi:hypothetical protein